MKNHPFPPSLFPSKCCSAETTTAGICTFCGFSVIEKKSVVDPKKQATYDEMWRNCFQTWDKVVDEIFTPLPTQKNIKV